jgi:hypothetical protein
MPNEKGNLLIIKTDDIGSEEWNKTYDVSDGICVEQTSDNGYIIGGWDYDQEDYHAILLKIDEYGDEMWINVYDDYNIQEGYGCDVELTENGDYVLTGAISWASNPNIYYVLLLRTDDDGNEEYLRFFNVADIDTGYVNFYGWDESNSCYFISIEIGGSYHGWGSGGSPLGYYETKYYGLCPGSYCYCISWEGKEGECSVNGILKIDAGEFLSIKQDLAFCDDLPVVSIDKPNNAVYINDNHIISFFTSIIIGGIHVDVTASDSLSGVYYVQFYIDGELMLKDNEEPYSFYWSKCSFGKHKLKVVVFDKVGYSKTREMTVMKFF